VELIVLAVPTKSASVGYVFNSDQFYVSSSCQIIEQNFIQLSAF